MRTGSGTRTSADGGGDRGEEIHFPRDFEGGDRVDRFVILRPIGEGGMGVVYLAQDPELDRKVALKFLRPAKRRSLERLRGRLIREAQAMARLDHPNVIAVHAVGKYEGQLYLAMEFVEGITLERWLKRKRRSWDEILPMFLAAGRGLVAVNQQGLIHRDFKPDNVQVGVDGSVRVMDFGLVRASRSSGEPDSDGSASEDRDESLRLTRVGDAVGTPAYMAPEQHLKLPVEAVADQFAFCVSLYEAFYRRRPFRGDNRAELSRSVLGGDIRPPPEQTDVPPALFRVIERGLAREPDDRWPSMQALLEALEAAVHRRSRWPWIMVGALAMSASAAALALAPSRSPCDHASDRLDALWNEGRRSELEASLRATGLPYAGKTWERVNTRLEGWTAAWRRVAEENCASTHERGEQDARSMDLRSACLADRADALRALLDVFSELDARVAQNAAQAVARLPDVSRCSDLAVLRAEVAPPEDPGTTKRVAELRRRLSAMVALHLAGKYAAALDVARAVATEAEASGYAPIEVRARYRYGVALIAVARDSEGEEALARAYFDAAKLGMRGIARDSASALVSLLGHRQTRFEEALKWAEHARVHLSQAPNAQAQARLLGRVGQVHRGLGRFDEAVTAHREALEILDSADGDHSLERARQLANLADALREMARYEDAREHLERANALREEVLGDQHPITARGHAELGNILRRLGLYEDSLAEVRHALSVFESTLEDPHPWRASALDKLASTLMAMGRHQEALAQYERAVEVYEAMQADPTAKLATTLSNMGVVLRRLGQTQRAIETHRRALALRENILGAEHPKVAASHNNLGACLYARERYDEAAEHFERALAIRRKTLEPGHPMLANALSNVAQMLVVQQRYTEASARYAQALRIREHALGAEHPALATALLGRAQALTKAGRAEDAIAPARRAVALRASVPEDRASLGLARLVLVESMIAAGEDAAQIRPVVELVLEQFGEDSRYPQRVRSLRDWMKLRR